MSSGVISSIVSQEEKEETFYLTKQTKVSFSVQFFTCDTAGAGAAQLYGRYPRSRRWSFLGQGVLRRRRLRECPNVLALMLAQRRGDGTSYRP
jgi:hypothetical protein